MDVYKLSLGTVFFNDASFIEMRENQVVSVHPETRAKGGSSVSQGQEFLNAQSGDVFFVCRSNNSIEFIGMFNDNRPFYSDRTGQADWIDRSYTLLYEAHNPNEYEHNLDKWWSPKNNSTFTRIPESELNDFSQVILEPVFNISIDKLIETRNQELERNMKTVEYYKDLQAYFRKLKSKPTFLFKEINKIKRTELKRIDYSYQQRGDFSGAPVVRLRYQIIQKLLNGDLIRDTDIDSIKEEISKDFPKNVFHSWKDPFRILYPIFYEKDKEELKTFFVELIDKFQKALGVEDETDFNLVHFDGSQNQGDDRIWFAIYNNSYPDQRLAKQLFFEINDGFKFGLLDTQNRDRDKIDNTHDFNYNSILIKFKEFKMEILNDNSEEMARIGEFIEILEYKKQVILQGPPGTGKTYSAKKIAQQLTESIENVKLLQFHPSYNYEDFVRGISTVVDKDGALQYKTVNRTLVDFANRAGNSEDYYILIIDEINRANLPSVLGELIYALEYRNEAVEGLYEYEGEKELILPDNLLIIGTMNTADRSVGHIDYAIKRRFAFVDVLPNEDAINTEIGKQLFREVSELFCQIKDRERKASEYLASDFDYKDVQLGHSYFLLEESEEYQSDELQLRLKFEILPILREYIKDGILLENATQKLIELENFEF